jgi:hypothetical protein
MDYYISIEVFVEDAFQVHSWQADHSPNPTTPLKYPVGEL